MITPDKHHIQQNIPEYDQPLISSEEDGFGVFHPKG
jgi:hypothetical protein